LIKFNMANFPVNCPLSFRCARADRCASRMDGRRLSHAQLREFDVSDHRDRRWSKF
jgi:hypothetical protein